MPLSAVLFDLDGTLVEFKVDYVLGRRMILNFARQSGFDMTGQTERRSMYDIIWHYEEIGDERAHKAVKEFAYDTMEKIEVEGANETKPFPDTIPILRAIKGNGYKTAIVTNSSRKAVDIVLERYPLRQYFDIVTTRDDVNTIKPDPDIVKRTLEMLGVKGKESIFVGDAPGDILAAKRADTISIAIPRGFVKLQVLMSAGPDYIIPSLEALPEIIEQINTQR